MRRPRINTRALQKIASSKALPIIKREALREVKKIVNQAHEEMLSQFENHPVTREIDSAGGGLHEASNTSGTLGGYGDLYSFIGFESGTDPVWPLRKILRKILKIRMLPGNHRNMIMNFAVEIPSKQELFEASPMPWNTGRSWAEGIERGISGLGQYLVLEGAMDGQNASEFFDPKSRSGRAFQVKNGPWSGGFKNTKYLSHILNELKVNLSRGIKR